MKKLEDSALQTMRGGLSTTSCGALGVASVSCAMGGFVFFALFGAAIYIGAGCAG